jgi:4-diphosphocytidyl-2-C-methyl-D-erythritol kinase
LSPLVLPELSGKPVLLINPRVELSTAAVFAAWDGIDRGPLGDWREGRNDLEAPAKALVPQIETALAWLALQPGVELSRMSGSGATCFALFDGESARDLAADNVPREWWRLATFLR